MNSFSTRKKLIVTILLTVVFAALALIGGCSDLLIVSDKHYINADGSLINENASSEAVKLMAFLKSQYGKRIISGQYVNEYEDFSVPEFRVDPSDPQSPTTVFKANEMQAAHKVTGDYPVVAGFDVSVVLLDQTNYSVEQAIEWHNAGGIVTFCWHWLVDNFDGKERAFYSEKTAFDLKKALSDKNSAQYKGIIADIDKVSEYMKELRDNNVPVLWRPLHEASGGWFWWGAGGEDAYKELWDIVYERMAVYHGLNNLIWVTNPQHPDWYVGDDKCDIVGDDPYYDFNEREAYEKDRSNKSRFKKNYAFAKNKMIAMTENDFIPNIDTAFDKNVKWLFFATWCREFVCEYVPDENGNYYTKPNYSAMCNSEEELIEIYSDDRVLTLGKLKESGLYDTVR